MDLAAEIRELCVQCFVEEDKEGHGEALSETRNEMFGNRILKVWSVCVHYSFGVDILKMHYPITPPVCGFGIC
jgi:hypothetical protein